MWKRQLQGRACPAAAVLLACALASFSTGCGGGAAVSTSTEAKQASAGTLTQATPGGVITNLTQPGSSDYPNLDEAEVSNVQSVAEAAYSRSWADGSGVGVTWGPNIISDWALLGVENVSGSAGKDVLLHKEGGIWAVKDIGHALVSTWASQTPPELWPQT